MDYIYHGIDVPVIIDIFDYIIPELLTLNENLGNEYIVSSQVEF